MAPVRLRRDPDCLGTDPTPRAPRPPRQAAGRFVSAVYRNEAGSLRYKLYVPSGYAGQALPPIVMLHGCKQEPDDFVAGTRMNTRRNRQLLHRLSVAVALRQRDALLELVRSATPEPRSRRAGASRRNRAHDHGRSRRGCRCGSCRRHVSGRSNGAGAGQHLSGPVSGRRRAFCFAVRFRTIRLLHWRP